MDAVSLLEPEGVVRRSPFLAKASFELLYLCVERVEQLAYVLVVVLVVASIRKVANQPQYAKRLGRPSFGEALKALRLCLGSGFHL